MGTVLEERQDTEVSDEVCERVGRDNPTVKDVLVRDTRQTTMFLAWRNALNEVVKARIDLEVKASRYD